MYDVEEDKGVDHFGGIRPGCWINMIPANGLMMMPEASSGCTCSFAIRCSLVMANKPERVTSNWTVFINHGDQKPVKHLAINFGAPGDKRDDEGTMWFAYPRPRAYSGIGYGYYGVKFKLSEEVLEGMGPYCRDYRGVEIKRSDKPWLFTSGYRGLVSCKLPLIDEAAGQDQGRYTVRMGFNAINGDKRGNRVFDVKLADKISGWGRRWASPRQFLWRTENACMPNISVSYSGYDSPGDLNNAGGDYSLRRSRRLMRWKHPLLHNDPSRPR